MSGGHTALSARFYDRPAETVARELLGAYLVSDIGGHRCVGRIVETEAYPGPHDPASHAARRVGRTARNDPMFGPPGTAYIHLNFGIHWCLNAVVGAEGFPAAVLIRAVEPEAGIEVMRERRNGRPDRELTSGPAKLAQALGIGPSLQRHRLTDAPLAVCRGARLPEQRIVRTPRIGISRGTDLEWRYCDADSRWLSRGVGAE